MYETVLQPDSAILDKCIMILQRKIVAGSPEPSKTWHFFPVHSFHETIHASHYL